MASNRTSRARSATLHGDTGGNLSHNGPLSGVAGWGVRGMVTAREKAKAVSEQATTISARLPSWWPVILSAVTLVGAMAIGASTQADQGARLTKVEGQVQVVSERLARIEEQTGRIRRIEDKIDGLREQRE